MMTDEEWNEQEERAERISELKRELSAHLKAAGISAFPYELEGDVLVQGPLSTIMEFCQQWRSEIEELG